MQTGSRLRASGWTFTELGPANKIARKLGWTTAFALRAIGEYKRFTYLGIISEFSVTPPRIIDQVWHEHLLFCRGYREYCRDVLGQDFDHHPELVPTDAQTDVFQAQFDATLALYHAEFNATPPADIWGTPKFDRAGTRRDPSRLTRRDWDVLMSSPVDDILCICSSIWPTLTVRFIVTVLNTAAVATTRREMQPSESSSTDSYGDSESSCSSASGYSSKKKQR